MLYQSIFFNEVHLKYLYCTYQENLKEVDEFLDKYVLEKLNQDKINNLSRPVTSDDVEAVIENLSTKSITEPSGSILFLSDFK